VDEVDETGAKCWLFEVSGVESDRVVLSKGHARGHDARLGMSSG
jgi:hypothetical protein